MSNNSPIKHIIWIFSPDDHLQEKTIFPNKKFFFEKKGWVLVPRGEIEFLKKNDQVVTLISKQDNTEKAVLKEAIIIGHDVLSIEGIDHLINQDFEVLDYSSSDGGFYKEMLSDFEEVDNQKQFEAIIFKWINFYRFDFRLDPIRRVKHRTLNLFSHIMVDIQTIQELCDSHDYERLFKIIEEIKESWARTKSSPSNQLKKLQYLLVGDGGIKTDVELLYFRGQKRPLYEWIRDLSKHKDYLNSSEWKKLRKISGVAPKDNSSKQNDNSSKQEQNIDIKELCIELEDTIQNPSTICEKIKKLQKDFYKWVNDLEKGFDNLKKIVKS